MQNWLSRQVLYAVFTQSTGALPTIGSVERCFMQNWLSREVLYTELAQSTGVYTELIQSTAQ